jgi:hypothetical protein
MSTNFPTPSITIKLGDETCEITMFFGLLHELAELVEVYERTPDMDFDASTRAAVLEIILSPRDERGRRIEGETVNFFLLSIDDAKAVLNWAKAHVTDFFLDRLEKHLAVLQANGERLMNVGSSLSGLAASASETR